MLKESIYHEEIIVQNVYASNNRFKIHDRTQKKNQNFLWPPATIIVGNFNTPLSTTNKLINWMLLKFKTSAL